MDGFGRTALRADTSKMRQVNEKPLILFLDRTENCAVLHEEVQHVGFEATIAETVAYAREVVHEYDEYDRARAMTVVIANPEIQGVMGPQGFISELNQTAYNRTVAHILSDKMDAKMRREGRDSGAYLCFQRKPYASDPEGKRQFREMVDEILNYVDHPEILIPRMHYEFDMLSQLPTVGRFNRKVEAAITAARRTLVDAKGAAQSNRDALVPSCRISVIIFDGDKFKEVNDHYGHHVGDKVIGIIGKTIREFCRSEDLTCRAGGDEFRVALVNGHEGDAVALALRIRDEVRNASIDTEIGTYIHPHISYGVAEATNDELLQGRPEDIYLRLLVAADGHMYDAKPGKRRRKRKPFAAA